MTKDGTKPESAPASVTPPTRTERDSEVTYYHDLHCNALRTEPMGGTDCFCTMYRRAANAESELATLRTERDELAAIVEKLPKDADGNPVVSSEPLFYPCPYRKEVFEIKPHTEYSYCPSGGCQLNIQHVMPSKCHNTREAAEAAREKTP